MSIPPFTVTFDYRCPHARTIHEHLVLGMLDGAGWFVTFTPFSLHQAHVQEGELDAWNDPVKLGQLTGMLAGIAVRDCQPEAFLAVHLALFTARHEQQLHLSDREGVARVIDAAGSDGASVLAEIDSGRPAETLALEHTQVVKEHNVFGVPTFIFNRDDLGHDDAEDMAVFVRLMDRPNGDATVARKTIERLVESITGWPALNEVKHTTVPR